MSNRLISSPSDYDAGAGGIERRQGKQGRAAEKEEHAKAVRPTMDSVYSTG